jgi:hypothetical protein
MRGVLLQLEAGIVQNTGRVQPMQGLHRLEDSKESPRQSRVDLGSSNTGMTRGSVITVRPLDETVFINVGLSFPGIVGSGTWA